ncbi:MAG: hypothetical protein WA667_27995 [Candidatus Nitrosopolaris sp.]
MTNASTCTLRANAGSSGVTVSIAASTSGVFTDAVDTYSSATYAITSATTGTNMKVSSLRCMDQYSPSCSNHNILWN